jgi:hypothetical protein
MTKSSKRLHFVDDDAQKVYLNVSSWFEALAAPHWVSKHYPGYKAELVTKEYLTELKR